MTAGEHQDLDSAALERLRGRLSSYMAKKGLRSTAQRRQMYGTCPDCQQIT
jgi:hypothetical protein